MNKKKSNVEKKHLTTAIDDRVIALQILHNKYQTTFQINTARCSPNQQFTYHRVSECTARRRVEEACLTVSINAPTLHIRRHVSSLEFG